MMRNMTAKINDILMEKLLTPGSRLRCAYETGLKGAGVISNEGVSSFIKKLTLYLYRNYIQPDLYAQWILENEDYSESYLSRVKDICNNFQHRPKFSIIFPVFNTEQIFLKKAIDSVLAQVYDNWELCAVDGNSTRPGVKEILDDYSREDSRIKVTFLPENEGIAGNSNCSLKMASGDYVVFLDHDDELSPQALYELARMINEDPSIDILYSDADRIDTAGRRSDPIFKPGWSPDLLRSCCYIGHILALRRELAVEVGGFRSAFEHAQDYDFILRAAENARKIHHINKILYHWRAHSGSVASNVRSKIYLQDNAKKALEEHCQRQMEQVSVLNGKEPFHFKVIYEHAQKPLVSLIIATDDNTDSLKCCLESIITKSSYDNYNIILVNNIAKNSHYPFLSEFKLFHDSIELMDYHGPDNWGAINNFAAKSCSGEILIFLGPDLEVISPDWIESLIGQALRKEIGAVGGLLISNDGRVLHAGLALGSKGGAHCIFSGMSREQVEAHSTANLMVNYIRNVSAVDRSCLCVLKGKFLDAGGFDENTKSYECDVEFCRILLKKGFLNIYTPFSVLACGPESETAKRLDADRSTGICDASSQSDIYYFSELK